MTNIDVIQERLGQPELLAQLAEEAAELGKAALKLRRVYTGINPTPVTGKEAFDNLLEELADVYTCIHVLGFDSLQNLGQVQKIVLAKMERWACRLEQTGSASHADNPS